MTEPTTAPSHPASKDPLLGLLLESCRAEGRPLTREDTEALDRQDPLAEARAAFDLPEGVIYLDGNSLGPMPFASAERVRHALEVEWRKDLINSWNLHGWFELPTTVGAKLARLVGADPDEVLATDSTTLNLYKLASAALDLRPDRRVILTERQNFPTVLYALQGLIDQRNGALGRSGAPEGDRYELRLVDPQEGSTKAVEAGLDDDVAVVCLTHVNYRTGAMYNLEEITRAAQDAGALMLWDLAHSTGAIDLDLHRANADLAVGCGYKYLNGGPGAPAFLFVARRHQEAARSPLQGWFGHEAQFAFEKDYHPAEGIRRFLCGTPPILSLSALDAALEVFEGLDMAQVRQKSKRLGDLFLALVDQRCAGHGLEIACPRDADRRGSQVGLYHPQGYPMVQALIARQVIGDYREPGILRFGLSPLILTHTDLWNAITHLQEILETREWDREEFHRRLAVT